jgi:ABC-type Zn uptake system ZnuABC Zn-binding protein ZnuA
MYIKNGLPKNQKKLKANTQNYIDNLQKNTQKVANSFQHQSLRYAS